MNEKEIEKLRNQLMPLYEELVNAVADQRPFDDDIENGKAFFCMQWGKNFPDSPNEGILFVGRATNGWHNQDYDVNSFFGNGEGQIFNEPNQMQWVEDQEGSIDRYNTKKSPFWRIIKKVSESFYPSNWSSYIAWSDVAKVAPYDVPKGKSANPSTKLYNAQIDVCKKIFAKEIEALKPKIVVFLTGYYNWAKDILTFLNGGKEPTGYKTREWGNSNMYNTYIYKINNINYVVSPHPQGKSEAKHAQCLTDIINDIR